MAISQPGGGFGPPQASNTGPEKKARGERGYGSVNAGFGMNSGGMDGVLGSAKQVNEGKEASNINPTMDAGTAKSVKR